MKRKRFGLASVAVAIALTLAACTGGGSGSSPNSQSTDGDFAACTKIYAAVSPEKVNLFTDLAKRFVDSAEGKALKQQLGLKDTDCIGIVPKSVGSGEATRLLKLGWPSDQTDTPQPTLWSPASTMWTSDVADSQGAALVPDPQSFATTPLVYAMPEEMARQLGWPDKPLGLQDLQKICVDPQGWSRFGGAAATWGPFKLGKTSPHTSTSGLNALLMQAYAVAKDAKGNPKTSGLTETDVKNAESFTKSIESCVIHYGDTTGNVLQRIYDRDQNGQSLSYVSAVAVEETSVISYNQGNPTSSYVKPEDQAKLVAPRKKLVAIYPSGGSLVSDDPIVVLGTTANAQWVTPQDRTIGEAFKKYVLGPDAQAILGNFGFRPADTKAKPTGLVTAQYGANPDLPKIILGQPNVNTTRAATAQWDQVRKPSSVLLLIDVSGSMGYDSGANDNKSRLQEAVDSAAATVDHFRPTDELGVWVFSTSLKSDFGDGVAVVRDVKPLGGDGENLKSQLAHLNPVQGTPLYDATGKAFDFMHKRAQAGRINAIVLLTDGEDSTKSPESLDALKQQLRAPAESNDPLQVRVFPIAYGESQREVLGDIASSSGGLLFDAKDPRRLKLIIASVMNNF